MALEAKDNVTLEAWFEGEMVALGIRVREIRKARVRNQDVLAKLSGLPSSTISEIENGKNNFEIKTLVKLACGLKVEVKDFLTETGKTYEPFIIAENAPPPDTKELKTACENMFQPLIITLGKQVLAIRNARKLRQIGLEEFSGKYAPAISDIENGKDNIEIYTVARLAYGLQVSLEDLLTETMKTYEPFK